ncbi:MAG: Spermidine/putrescine import ATP-binding protein PotA [Planctomycetota bacterium]|jgi:iron(III) transport system ATP-binding protein
MTSIRIDGLVKRFGETTAVSDVRLEIPAGSLFFLLGPSGCGKTTLLRMIAGFTEPTGGRILFGGKDGERDVARLPANQRNTGMVFQNYALWPHMSVFDNVAFGLEVRKLGKADIASRVAKALDLVKMGEYARRKPSELSGGQQQRVALARAVVFEPSVLLLDEPLSNLDAKLRLEMRHEIRRIVDTLGITTVYVTHDQDEALSLADGMAVLDRGRIVQTGAPREMYRRPRTRFVADFLGETNFLPALLVRKDGAEAVYRTAAGELVSSVAPFPEESELSLSLRPEAFVLRAPGAAAGGRNVLAGRVESSIYLGGHAQHEVRLAGCDATLRVSELNPRAMPAQGAPVELAIDPDDVVPLAS